MKHHIFAVKLRLMFYSLVLLHVTFICGYMLLFDFKRAENVQYRVYDTMKWKLITTWFHLSSLVYLLISIYCEYKVVKGQSHINHVQMLNKFRYICFTSIIFPVTCYADLFFWRLWVLNTEYLAPPGINDVIPYWVQHSLHTVSLIAAIFDLLLTARKRPESLIPGLTVTVIFSTVYFMYVVYNIYAYKIYVYPFLRLLSVTQLTLVAGHMVLETAVFYFLQWYVLRQIWGKEIKTAKIK